MFDVTDAILENITDNADSTDMFQTAQITGSKNNGYRKQTWEGAEPLPAPAQAQPCRLVSLGNRGY